MLIHFSHQFLNGDVLIFENEGFEFLHPSLLAHPPFSQAFLQASVLIFVPLWTGVGSRF